MERPAQKNRHDAEETLDKARVVRASERPDVELNDTGDFIRGMAVGATGAKEAEVWDCEIAPGASTILHYHDTEQVILVIEGSIAVDIEGRQIHLGKDDAVIMDAGCVHQLHNGPEKHRHIGIMGKAGARTFLTTGEEIESNWQQ